MVGQLALGVAVFCYVPEANITGKPEINNANIIGERGLHEASIAHNLLIFGQHINLWE